VEKYKNRLRWLMRVLRREETEAVRLEKRMYVKEKRGKPKQIIGCD